MTLRTLRWGNYHGCSRGTLHTITRILIRRRERTIVPHTQMVRRSSATAEAEVSDVAEIKGCPQGPEATRTVGTDSAPETPKGAEPCRTPCYQPSETDLDS